MAGIAGVLSIAMMPPAALAAGDADSAASASPLEEVVVTATRREESLSKVAVSVTAITQEGLDLRGIKDIQDIARFTPGIKVDASGTNNISIRGIASSGGAGTTGIYIDDTPIQMRTLAFNPDEALPKSFDIDRVEVLRGPQGTLFGAGSMGGTVRYITAQPNLHKSSIYSRSEIAVTQGGDPSYEAGVAVGGPIVEGTFGARLTAWYRKDGGWIDRINPDTLAMEDKRANHGETTLLRLAAVWAPSDKWTITPSIYYQDEKKNDVSNYWVTPICPVAGGTCVTSDPSSHRFISANPTRRDSPDKLYMPTLKIEADLGSTHLISSTSYYHRDDTTGYDGTLYNLGFYQSFLDIANGYGLLPNNLLLLDGTGVHLANPAFNNLPGGIPGAIGYRAPASVDNGQRNFTQEIRLQSTDNDARLTWTTGLFYAVNKQTYLEQLHDPMLGDLLRAVYVGTGQSLGPTATPNDYILDFFGIGYDPNYPNDSYFLNTHAKDEQIAWFGEGNYKLTDRLKLTVGGRYAKMKFNFSSATGGPQLYDSNAYLDSSRSESAFTPKVGLQFQADPDNMYYITYAKGFRPGGGNNPLPIVACAQDFDPQHLDLPNGSPPTFDSDSVNSYEVGAKNNFDNRVRLASSIYYIKWHNIQQTVLPPVCQISFITNLGEATAKGADIQADIAFTDHFTMELAAGYTEARYTRDSLISKNPDVPPIVSKGDAISGQGGQPAAPFTASMGFQYKYNAFGRESFTRLDFQHTGAPKWLSPARDPVTSQFTETNYALPATNFLTLRSGMQFGEWEFAAFIDNLTDTHPVTGYDFTIATDTAFNTTQRNYTFRPRTIGLTATFRR